MKDENSPSNSSFFFSLLSKSFLLLLNLSESRCGEDILLQQGCVAAAVYIYM